MIKILVGELSYAWLQKLFLLEPVWNLFHVNSNFFQCKINKKKTKKDDKTTFKKRSSI